ncbi:MAG TPA: DUF3035 domain-containing protein [Alphaproteobacteria bacterium]|nr:DUF3035 domain-containing protein [Alphaproteobacteria bacterium]
MPGTATPRAAHVRRTARGAGGACGAVPADQPRQPGERALVATAGGTRAGPFIRVQLAEEAGIAELDDAAIEELLWDDRKASADAAPMIRKRGIRRPDG